MIKHPMLSPDLAKKRTGSRENANFIRHISAYTGEKIVYDISTSPYLKKNPIFKFKYNYEGKGDQVQLIVTDNKGKQVSSSKKIVNSLDGNSSLSSKTTDVKPIDYWIKYPNIWEISSTKEVIKKLYGPQEPTIGGVKLDIIKHPSYYVTIKITSKLELESIAVLSEDTRCNKNDTIPSLRAIISVPKNTLIDYDLDIITIGNCFGACCGMPIPITIFSKDKDGNLYENITNTPYYGCNHGCEGDGS